MFKRVRLSADDQKRIIRLRYKTKKDDLFLFLLKCAKLCFSVLLCAICLYVYYSIKYSSLDASATTGAMFILGVHPKLTSKRRRSECCVHRSATGFLYNAMCL